MVSQSNTLVTRGSSSIMSASRTRRPGKSHTGGTNNQSPTQNEFPIFSSTGDVEVMIKAGSKTNRYLLHRLYLSQCSGFFEAATSDDKRLLTGPADGGDGQVTSDLQVARIARDGSDSDTISSPHGAGTGTGAGRARQRWRFELERGGNSSASEASLMLTRRDPTTPFFSHDPNPPPVRNKPTNANAQTGSHPSFFRSVANLSLTSSASSSSSSAVPLVQLSQADRDLLTSYDSLFRIFYNYPPTLDAVDIAQAYVQCKTLLALATSYDCLHIVGPRVDHHLLQFQSRLWRQVAKYPASYLKLGYMAQSKTIFQEALVHVVGAWPAGEKHLRNQLPRDVLELIEEKVEDLEDVVARIESRLFRMNLLTSRGERVTPHHSYLDWLVVSHWRSWLIESTTPPPPPPPPSTSGSRLRASGAGSVQAYTRRGSSSGGSNVSASHPSSTIHSTTSPFNKGRIYRAIGNYSPTSSPTKVPYLSHDDCKKLLRGQPDLYNRESLRRFEKRLDELKCMAREVVRPLMKSELLGDASTCSYLVCTRISDDDFPWD